MKIHKEKWEGLRININKYKSQNTKNTCGGSGPIYQCLINRYLPQALGNFEN